MTLSKILQFSIFGLVTGYVSGKIENWGVLQPIYQSELFLYTMLVFGTFCVMVTTARLLGTKSWDEVGQHKLFTRRFTLEASLMCGFVMLAYPLLRYYGIDRDSVIKVLVTITGFIYVIGLNHTLRKTGRGQVWPKKQNS